MEEVLMRKVKVGAVLVAIACSSIAYGQSSVTLYGVVDPALVFVNNAQVNKAGGVLHGAQQYELVDAWTAAYAGSRFGIKGYEDLGGGTAAIFTLENGFNVNSGTLGQGGLMFGRQAFVGLTNNSWGTVTAGRQYSSMVDYVSPISSILQWGGYMTAHPDDVDNLAMTNRQNNALKLGTPVWNGFSANALYSFGGVAGNTSENQIITAAAGYTGGPLRVGVGFLSAFDPNISMWGSQPNAGGVTTNNLGSFGSARPPRRIPSSLATRRRTASRSSVLARPTPSRVRPSGWSIPTPDSSDSDRPRDPTRSGIAAVQPSTWSKQTCLIR
jgi:predicted porin